MRGRWTSLCRHSPIRSTPRAAFRFLPPFAPCSPRTALTAFIAIRRSMRLRSMQAASGWSTRSTALSRIWRLIPTSATTSPPLYSAPAKSFLSIRMDAPFCRSGSGARRHHHPHHLRRPRREVPDVGTRTICNAFGGSAPKGPRSPQIARRGAPRKRRARGSTGMMAGRGTGFVGRRRTGPPHSRDALGSALRRLSPSDGKIFIDGTFGAGGYTAASSKRRGAACSPSTAIRSAISPRALGGNFPGRLVCPRPLCARCGDRRTRGGRRRRRRRARSWRLFDAARRGRARFLLHERRTARHAHGPARPDRSRCRQHTVRAGAYRDHRQARRGAAGPRDRQSHRRAPQRAAHRHDRRARRDRRARARPETR